MTDRNTWKLQDAKARFSELVRRAKGGNPQQVTVHGRKAVIVIDPERFDIRAKPAPEPTLAGFIKRSRKYRDAADGIALERGGKARFRDKRSEIFDSDN